MVPGAGFGVSRARWEWGLGSLGGARTLLCKQAAPRLRLQVREGVARPCSEVPSTEPSIWQVPGWELPFLASKP